MRRADHLGRSPADGRGAGEGEHEQHQAGGDRDRPGHVEAASKFGRPALAHEQGHQHQRQDADRDVDEEDPLPARVLREDAAEEHADRRAGAGDPAEDAERLVPLRALREGDGRDREDRRREDRSRSTLQQTEDDQLRRRGRKPAQQGERRERGQADHEHAPATEDVAQAAAEQNQAAVGQGVPADDPLQAGRRREVQILLDRRQRHVHDRHVEDDHQEGDPQDRQRLPALWISAHTNAPPCRSAGSGSAFGFTGASWSLPQAIESLTP